MLQFEELRLELNDNKQKLSELREALGLDALKEEIAKLEEQTAAEEFWGDIENSQKVLQRISQLKNKVAAYTSLETAFDDTMTLIELADEEEDLSMFDECREGVTKFEDELEKQTLSTLLNGEYDAKNALLTFHAGAGGTESCDWCSRRRTGRRCSSVCISTGARSTTSRSACSTFLTATRRVSNPPFCSSRVRMHTAISRARWVFTALSESPRSIHRDADTHLSLPLKSCPKSMTISKLK